MPHDPPDTETDDERVDRVILEYLDAVDAGREPDRRALLARYPDLADELTAFFADQDRLARLARAARLPKAETTADEPARAGAGDAPESVGGYRLLRLLGAGGMGRVYEAVGAGGQRVAVKLLAPGLADSPTTLERFRQEGRLASRLSHPRCVFVHTADQDGGQPYIVMELMSGATLKDLVEGAGPLEPADAVARILDVIEGLEEAHRAGVLHRDVKPANCYLDADGRVKVGDFGLSRSLAAGSHLTRTGGFVGTPLFASPEQLKGEALDGRTDVYSVAATLYFLLTGQAPFQHADGATVIARVVSEPAPPPRRLRPDLPPALEEVVLRGLERQRERRFADLPALREALLPLLPGQMTIAGLGLRFGALLLDSLPLSVAGEVIGLLRVSHGGMIDPPFMLAMAVPVFVYFWLGDGVWGCSVAKWLLRLRVTRAGGGERPGLGRAFLRTAVFVATGGLVTNLLTSALIDQVAQPVAWALLGAGGGVLSLALRFSTMRARNGYRGLHEFLSDTRVVQLPTSPRPRRPGREVTSCRRPAAPPPDGVPHQLGGFAVRGVLCRDGDEMLLLGEDAALGRQAWLWWRPAAALPAARREQARGGRLRWLSAGTERDHCWDAFVAPEGVGLIERVRACGPLDWGAARLLLEGLAEELCAAAADGTRPSRLSLEQVCLGAHGRVQLLDWAPAGPLAPEPPADREASDEPALALLRQAAALALEGDLVLSTEYSVPSTPHPRPLPPKGEGEKKPLQAVLPLHARRILARLAGGPGGYTRPDELRADLAAARVRPAETTALLRAFQLAISFCVVAVGFGMMLGWSRNGAIVRALALDRAMLQAQVLRDVLRDEQLPPNDPLRADAELPRVLDESRARDNQELDNLFASLGWLSYLPKTVPPLRLRRVLGGGDEPLRIARRPGEPYRLEVVRLQAPEEVPLVMEKSDLDWAAARARGEAPDPVGARLGPAVVVVLISLSVVPLLLIGSAVALRGGLSLRLAGLALVRADGRDAGRLRCGWRVFVVWVPVVLVLLPIVGIDLRRPDLLWLYPILQGLAVLLLLTNAALALRFPRRSYPDWLAGTYVVPR